MRFLQVAIFAFASILSLSESALPMYRPSTSPKSPLLSPRRRLFPAGVAVRPPRFTKPRPDALAHVTSNFQLREFDSLSVDYSLRCSDMSGIGVTTEVLGARPNRRS